MDSIEILPEVVFDVVDDKPLQFYIESRGVVEPVQRIAITPRIGGFVEQHAVIDGNWVKEGELILQLDSTEWQYNVKEARDNYLRAKNEYDIEVRLRGDAEVNENSLIRITTGLAEAETAYDRARLNLSYTTISAPFSGFISTKNVVTNGAYISAGLELGSLINTSLVKVRFDVLESEITSLSRGMSVELKDPSGRNSIGKIVAISPEIDQKTKTGQAIIEVDNSSNTLKTGMTVEGRVFVKSVKDKVRMPREALLERDGRTLVFKLTGTEVEWIYVTPIAMNSEWVLVNHENIAPGDTLAVDKHFSISHQQNVVPLMSN